MPQFWNFEILKFWNPFFKAYTLVPESASEIFE